MANLTHEILNNNCCFSYTAKHNNKDILFLDRDGVLNYDTGYVYRTEDLNLIKPNIKALKILSKKYDFIVITNQSGIDRGFYNWEDYINFTNNLFLELKEYDISILSFIAISYHEEFSQSHDYKDWRKPNIGALNFLENIYKFKKEDSFYIGDRITDVEFASIAGFKGAILLNLDKYKKNLDKLKLEYRNLKKLYIVNYIDINLL